MFTTISQIYTIYIVELKKYGKQDDKWIESLKEKCEKNENYNENKKTMYEINLYENNKKKKWNNL